MMELTFVADDGAVVEVPSQVWEDARECLGVSTDGEVLGWVAGQVVRVSGAEALADGPLVQVGSWVVGIGTAAWEGAKVALGADGPSLALWAARRLVLVSESLIVERVRNSVVIGAD